MLIAFNNKTFMDYVKEVNPFELNIEKANKLDDQESYLDFKFVTMIKTERSYV